jgi:hypothetical protein
MIKLHTLLFFFPLLSTIFELQVKLISKFTSPPDYLTESELITLMEKNGIGTVYKCTHSVSGSSILIILNLYRTHQFLFTLTILNNEITLLWEVAEN